MQVFLISSEFQFDFSVEKFLMDKKLSFAVWGKDVFGGTHVEAYSWYVDPYPQTVSPLFGGTVSYHF